MQQAVRIATFEVVVPKVTPDPLTYEKPLPLELVPFVVRRDLFWSIGTAFAVGPTTYVTAAHVLLPTISSEFGAPGIRDGAGHVYVIDRILGCSAHQDFVVFTVSGAPPAAPLPTSTDHRVDSVVFAVGNALGEGVVIRDGLLTSETPEPQDGRWNFLRFSAAASPGNSGGPLLDAEGRVIGVVLAKSPSENLNYGLPIELVLAGNGHSGSIDVRYSIKLPVTQATAVANVKAEIPLPAAFPDFARDYRALLLRQRHEDQARLLREQAATLFPAGNSRKLLATVYDSLEPAFVQEQQDESWDTNAAADPQTRKLDPDGQVFTGTDLGVSVFRLRRPGGASDDAFFHDPRASMDLVLKGLKIYRPVGSQAIRVTSLGAPRKDVLHTDTYGRRWQVRVWPLAFTDTDIIAFELPVPEGYVGFVSHTTGVQLELELENMKLLANYFYVSYAGTLPQWSAFLARRDLRPTVFDQIRISTAVGRGISYRSPRLALDFPVAVIVPDDQNTVELRMSYFLDHGMLAWDVGAVHVWQDELHKSYAGAYRHARPTRGVDRKMDDAWDRMRNRMSGFNGTAGHDAEFGKYWIRDVVSAPGPAPGLDPAATVLYELGMGTEESRYPHELEQAFGLLRAATQVLER
jgi:hypothetical protein